MLQMLEHATNVVDLLQMLRTSHNQKKNDNIYNKAKIPATFLQQQHKKSTKFTTGLRSLY